MEFDAFGPAGEAVLGRWQSKQVGRSGEKEPAWSRITIDEEFEREHEFGDSLNLVDGHQPIRLLIKESDRIGPRGIPGEVVVERNQTSFEVIDHGPHQCGLANLPCALHDDDSGVRHGFENPRSEVAIDRWHGSRVRQLADSLRNARRFAESGSPIR